MGHRLLRCAFGNGAHSLTDDPTKLPTTTEVAAMSVSMKLGALLVLALLTITPQPSFSIECGDLDGDCSVTVTDSLRLLRRAVGLNVGLLCECNGDSICETRTPAQVQSVVQDCFGDEACPPSKPYCDSHTCSVCSMNEHCGEGFSCDHALYRCMPSCVYD
jgi:hypothetical protein